jgi:uncharacterized protein (DUF1501 family)
MLHRRDFLRRTLYGSSLLALGPVVPQFIAGTARAAEAGKDNILVVVEMTGGNDGLNTVIPFANDAYHKARPTLGYGKGEVVRLNDELGLNPGMRSFESMWKEGQLAVVQGVGYPNPDHSHFESMDIWQSADPKRKITTGWLGRSAGSLSVKRGVPMLHVGGGKLPTALSGAPGSAVSINDKQPYHLDLGGGSKARHTARRTLIDDLAHEDKVAGEDSLLNFVQRRQVETFTTLDRLEEVLQKNRNPGRFIQRMDGGGFRFYQQGSLPQKLQLVASLIRAELGTRVFYVTLNGFDTHSRQKDHQRTLLAELADGVGQMFQTLRDGGHDKRVRLMTFSEFGRRVRENGSKGTDHGSGSCLFVAGPSVKGAAVGKHPSLDDLDNGDLRYHTDFRSVYATLLDAWLGCDSKAVLGGRFGHIEALKA